MRITTKGQVTIPLEVRQRMGLLPRSEVESVMEGNGVYLRKASSGGKSSGARLVETMRGRATVRMTTDEIMALTRGEIDSKSGSDRAFSITGVPAAAAVLRYQTSLSAHMLLSKG